MDGPEDQVAASIVEAFKSLKTVQARQTVYDDICFPNAGRSY